MRNSLFLIIMILAACTGKKAVQEDGNSPMKFEQYLVEGQRLYQMHCANCHQADGQGLGKLYPPLASSDYLKDSLDKVPCIIKKGLNGKVLVNGVEYNQPMPPNPNLTPLEIAEIVTYVANSWGNESGMVEVTAVSAALKDCTSN